MSGQGTGIPPTLPTLPTLAASRPRPCRGVQFGTTSPRSDRRTARHSRIGRRRRDSIEPCARRAGWLPGWSASAQRGRLPGLVGGAAITIAITPCQAAGDNAPGQDGPTAGRGGPRPEGSGSASPDSRVQEGTRFHEAGRSARWRCRRATAVRSPTAKSGGGEGGLGFAPPRCPDWTAVIANAVSGLTWRWTRWTRGPPSTSPTDRCATHISSV